MLQNKESYDYLGLNFIDFGWMFWVVYKFLLGCANEGWDMIPYE